MLNDDTILYDKVFYTFETPANAIASKPVLVTALNDPVLVLSR